MNVTLGSCLQLLQKEGLVKDARILPGDMGRTVSRLSCDSQEEQTGGLFVCKGMAFKEEYLAAALSVGAFAYVAGRDFPAGAAVSRILVTDVRRAMALLAPLCAGFPAKKLTLIGITGTKGKSSTTYYVKYILDELLRERGGAESAVISSIDTYDGIERYESHITTPEPIELQRHFKNAAESGIEYLEMEVSSQALRYDRVLGVTFDVGCYLNIGADHISPMEHPDAEDYFQSKLKLFRQCSVACVNLDADRAAEVLETAGRHARRVITFGRTPEADVYGSEIEKSGHDILFRVRTPRFSRKLRLTMPGLFNVENALAAVAVSEALGVPERYIYTGLMKARVPGRMEVYTNADGKLVAIVDYAHNRMSFEKLFQSVREEYPGRKVVVVFGCPGRKALDRRKDLGEVSGRCADRVILTEEDSGEEPTEQICAEIASHVAAAGCDYSILPDRGEAVATAVLDCDGPTVLLITGKGAETRQKRGRVYETCPSDVEYVKNALHRYDVIHRLDGMEKVRSLMDLLPLLNEWAGQTIVVKYGGSALSDGGAAPTILADAAALRMVGARVVLVHGGGRAISGWLSKFGVKSDFLAGYRVTDGITMDVAEMALSGQVNKQIVSALGALGVSAAGISGRDGSLLRAAPKRIPEGDLGRVGEIVSVNPKILKTLLDGEFLPVVSPVAADGSGAALNCNADDAACAVAEALGADKLLFLTDTDGILVDARNRDTRIARMGVRRVQELIEGGFADGGMLPKLKSCVHAVTHGVGRVVILDGRVEHSLLLESLSKTGMGTVITKDEE